MNPIILLWLGEIIMISKNMFEDIDRVLISEEELKAIVDRLGKQISEDYKDKKLLLVSVLKGAVVFMADIDTEKIF